MLNLLMKNVYFSRFWIKHNFQCKNILFVMLLLVILICNFLDYLHQKKSFTFIVI